MKKTALVLLLVSAAAGSLQAQSNYTPMVTLRRPLVNIGVKAGFNSSMFFIDELSIDGKELEGVQALVKTKVTSIDLPILYGYKFIDVHPYGMAFFVGPKVAWSWKQQTENEYSGFYQQAIRETGYPFNYSAVAGLGVNVSNVFFDFRYEIGLHNLTRSIDFDRQATEAPYNESMIVVRKRRNVMSFSVGVIF